MNIVPEVENLLKIAVSLRDGNKGGLGKVDQVMSTIPANDSFLDRETETMLASGVRDEVKCHRTAVICPLTCSLSRHFIQGHWKLTQYMMAP